MIKTVLTRLRATGAMSFLVFLVSGATVLACWLYTTPYIRVPGSIISVRTTCVPREVRLKRGESYAVTRRAALILRNDQGVESFEFVTAGDAADRKADEVLTMPLSQQTAAGRSLARAGSQMESSIVIDVERSPYIDVRQVALMPSKVVGNQRCTWTLLEGRDLLQNIDRGSPKLMRIRLPQEEISNWIFYANESGGTALLAALVLAFFWIAAQVGNGLWVTYGQRRSDLEAAIRARADAVPTALREQGLEAVICADFAVVQRRLHFARAMGPAIGFLLTVSSLVAGLHPSAQSAYEAFRFISSLQIALVATFLGLAVRIAAEFALRAHQHAVDRKLAIATDIG